MNSTLLFKLFKIFGIVASTFASPISTNSTVTLKKRSNINYYKDLKLDVYYSESEGKHSVFKRKPVVVYIHGGGWVSGSKEKNSKIGEYLSEQGYVAVLPSYHLYPNATSIDTMVDEIHHAITWTYKNIYDYNGNNLRMSISGQSAGAHLISLTLTKSALGIENNGKPLEKLPTFKHALLLNGPYDMRKFQRPEMDDTYKNLFYNKKNTSAQPILEGYEDKSIMRLGTRQITFLECTEDIVVPYGNAEPMIEQVKRTVRSTKVDHIVIEGGDHNKINHGIRDGDEEAKKIFIELIRKYNKPFN